MKAIKAASLKFSSLKPLQELTVPLGHWLKRFPDAAKLHPFERSLLVLTLGDGTYETSLARVNALRKKLLEIGKQHAAACAKATNVKEADERRKEVGLAFHQLIAHHLVELSMFRRSLAP